MKKLFLFLAVALIAFVCDNGAMAQERTVNINVPPGYTYYNYTGSAADTLTATNQDTIDVIFWFRIDEYVEKVAVKTRYDLIVGADTTVALTVAGKEFSDHTTYVDVVASALSSAVSTNNIIQVSVSDPYIVEASYMTDVGANDSTNVQHNHTPFDKTYRYYRLRYILQGDDAVGTGVLIDDIEIKLYTD